MVIKVSDIISVVCYKLAAIWTPRKNCQLFSETYGVTSYASGWRKEVVNQCLAFASKDKFVWSQLYTHSTSPPCRQFLKHRRPEDNTLTILRRLATIRRRSSTADIVPCTKYRKARLPKYYWLPNIIKTKLTKGSNFRSLVFENLYRSENSMNFPPVFLFCFCFRFETQYEHQ